MTKIKVLLADDHTLVRKGIRSLLEGQPNLEIVGEAQNGSEALEKVKALSPDVLLMDIAMPIMSGIEATAEIAQHFPGTRCLILSMHDNEDYIIKSVEAGAFGYLLKDNTRDEMLGAIKTIANGEKYFSPSVSHIIVDFYLQQIKKPKKTDSKTAKLSKQEKAILKYIVAGSNSREIAEKLNLSVRTVDNHRGNMMRRLQVKNAVELVRKALDEKLL